MPIDKPGGATSGAMGTLSSTRRRVADPASPSLDSDVLSGSGIPSSAYAFDAEGSGWVLFSPQLLAEVAPERLEQADEALQRDIVPDASLEPIEPLDLRSSAVTLEAEHSGLELPGHNGNGAFLESEPSAALSPHRDMFERINAWRLEQSQLLYDTLQSHHHNLNNPSGGDGWQAPDSDDKDGNWSLWSRIRHQAAWIGQYLVYDDETLDALMNPDFVPREFPAVHKDRTHFLRAKRYGPPGWDERARQHALSLATPSTDGSSIIAVLTKFLLWKYDKNSAAASAGVPDRLLNVPSQMEHSYHLDAIQASIATLSTSISSTFSDSATTMSISTAA